MSAIEAFVLLFHQKKILFIILLVFEFIFVIVERTFDACL